MLRFLLSFGIDGLVPESLYPRDQWRRRYGMRGMRVAPITTSQGDDTKTSDVRKLSRANGFHLYVWAGTGGLKKVHNGVIDLFFRAGGGGDGRLHSCIVPGETDSSYAFAFVKMFRPVLRILSDQYSFYEAFNIAVSLL